MLQDSSWNYLESFCIQVLTSEKLGNLLVLEQFVISYNSAKLRNRNTMGGGGGGGGGGAGVRGCEAVDHPRETSTCEGQKLGGL